MRVRASSSHWTDAASARRYPSLDRDLRVDVVIVGGGITGLTAAYLLSRNGFKVAVIERRRLTGVDTSNTSAHVTAVTDTRLSALVRAFGEDHARASWDAGYAAIDSIHRTIRDLGIDCGFAWVPGYLHASPFVDVSRGEVDLLKEEVDAATSLGFDARYLDSVPLFGRPGVEYPGQARFHPRKYLEALARAVEQNAGMIFEDSAVEDVTDEPRAAVANGHRIECRDVVIATHTPIMGHAGLLSATTLQTKLALYSTYAVGGRVATGRVPDALFWDLDDPYHYLRIDPQPGFDYVIFGGEDHKTGQQDDTSQCVERLEGKLKQILPAVDVADHWSGQVIETNDGLPFIGETARGQFAATGFSGNGMTFGTLAAMMAADAVMGRANPWAELFDTSRTKVRGGLWDYLKENKDYPYYLIRDRFAGPEARNLRDIPRGTGRITDADGTLVAAFRADDGGVTTLSPICTHMGCHVEWNDAERTWDCPCHGSRFLPDGDVLSGPAESPLEKVVVPPRKP
jgi:glycine/D-amino acid oxidase-like deaminating enzyme/nitrite reductase/ring-hydroxylating ferredoxin subunit